MDKYGRRSQHLSAVISKDQIKIPLNSYLSTEVPEIVTEADYKAAQALYAAMDASVPSQDLHSPVARYVLALGVLMNKWEAKHIPAAD